MRPGAAPGTDGGTAPERHAACAQVLAYVSRVKDVVCTVDNETFTIEDVEANDVRCPDQEAAKLMYKGGHPHLLGEPMGPRMGDAALR